MRENRPYGSEGGGPQTNAASLPLSPGEPFGVPGGKARVGVPYYATGVGGQPPHLAATVQVMKDRPLARP